MSRRIITRQAARSSWLCPRCSTRISILQRPQTQSISSRHHDTFSIPTSSIIQPRHYSTPATNSSPLNLPADLKATLDSFTSTSSTTENLNDTMRTDFKEAMRNKDQARLTVLRDIFADLKNAEKDSKTGASSLDNLAIRAMLSKKIAAARQAADGFASAGRQDLADKERAQAEVMEGYVAKVQVISREVVQRTVQKVYELFEQEKRNASVGNIMQALVGKEGIFTGRNVDKSTVSEVIQEFTKKKG